MLLKKANLFLATLFISASLFANPTPSKSSNLKSLSVKIQSIRNSLAKYQHQKNYLKNNLENTEKSIGKIAKRLHHTNVLLSKSNAFLNKNRTKQTLYQAQLKEQEKLLAEQTRAIYMLGREPYLKIILNQQDPMKISRYLHYYAALNEARLNIIEKIQKTTESLTKTAQDINQQTENLKIVQTKQQEQNNSLNKEKNYRKYLLQHTQNSIQSKKESLNKLLQNKTHLERVVTSLNAEKMLGYVPGKSFQQMKGRLIWPIPHAKVIQSYGAPIAGGRLRSTGLIIQANMGEPIYAVFPGKVIFADWLNGFGLLVIIQHGQNYMTLYGRNQSLYVKQGDEVKPGEVIATAGNSGGFDSPALYFEIRYKSNPVNPSRWLHR